MTTPHYLIEPQQSGHQPLIEDLLDKSFGLGRQTKTSYRLREGEQPIDGLSFVAESHAGEILGAISFWSLCIGEAAKPALLLGPLAVDPAFQGCGIGRALMRHGLSRAQELGHGLVILVGDEPYYARVGFRRVPGGHLLLPGPVDPARLLFLELEPGTMASASGLVLSPSRLARLNEDRARMSRSTALRDTTSG